MSREIDAFEIGVREGLEACLVVLLLLALVARPWSTTQRVAFVRWAVAAFAGSVAVSVVIYESSASVSPRTLATVELAASALAVAMLSATALWTLRLAASPGPPQGIAPGTAAAVASLTLARETIESTYFLLALRDADDRGHLADLAGGALLAVALTAACFGVGLRGVSRRTYCLIAHGLLILVAGGMVMSLVRSARLLVAPNSVAEPWLEIGRLQEPHFAVVRAIVSVVGLRPSISATEALAWSAYAVLMGVTIWRVPGALNRSGAGAARR